MTTSKFLTCQKGNCNFIISIILSAPFSTLRLLLYVWFHNWWCSKSLLGIAHFPYYFLFLRLYNLNWPVFWWVFLWPARIPYWILLMYFYFSYCTLKLQNFYFVHFNIFKFWLIVFIGETQFLVSFSSLYMVSLTSLVILNGWFKVFV